MDFSPKKIEKVKDSALRIIWEDEHVTTYSFRRLRQLCPCAACVDERTGKRTLDPETISKDLKAWHAGMVGNYALSFAFSDGHSSGVYPFEMLRQRCPCAACR